MNYIQPSHLAKKPIDPLATTSTEMQKQSEIKIVVEMFNYVQYTGTEKLLKLCENKLNKNLRDDELEKSIETGVDIEAFMQLPNETVKTIQTYIQALANKTDEIMKALNEDKSNELLVELYSDQSYCIYALGGDILLWNPKANEFEDRVTPLIPSKLFLLMNQKKSEVPSAEISNLTHSLKNWS